MAIEETNLDNWFSHHTLDPDQQAHVAAIREQARILARCIVANTPPSADQTAAIRLLREAVFTANASIACKGR